MRARQLHHYYVKVRSVKNWQLAILLMLSILLSASLLRLNNLNMIQKRQAVISADQQLDREAAQQALVDLQNYVSAHMNTGLDGGVFLEKIYQDDQSKAMEAAANTPNPNSAAYQQASVDCRSRFRGGVASYRNDYVQCVVEKLNATPASQDALQSLQLPSADRYRFDFVSPLWSVDFAGFLALITVVIVVIIATRLISGIVLSLLLRYRYS